MLYEHDLENNKPFKNEEITKFVIDSLQLVIEIDTYKEKEHYCLTNNRIDVQIELTKEQAEFLSKKYDIPIKNGLVMDEEDKT